jgi:hypothetical protein
LSESHSSRRAPFWTTGRAETAHAYPARGGLADLGKARDAPLDRADEVAPVERLGEVVVGAERHPLAYVDALAERAQEEKGNPLQLGQRAHRLAKAETVHPRHGDVGEDHIRVEAVFQLFEGALRPVER